MSEFIDCKLFSRIDMKKVQPARRVRPLIDVNLNTGSEQVQAFKAILKETLYEDFSEGSMAIGMRTIEAHKKSNADKVELIDLMLFFVECGSQFTLDFGDIDEDFYMTLETVFEDTLILIKNDSAVIFELYKDRLLMIEQKNRNMSWGYGDQIQDLLDENFPGFLESHSI